MKAVKSVLAAVLSLSVVAPAIAGDYIPYHKENLMTAKDAIDPTMKEVGIIDGLMYGIGAHDDGTTADFEAEAYPEDADGKHADTWRVTCLRDPMTDEKMCSLHKSDLAFIYRGGDLLNVDAGLISPINISAIETRGTADKTVYKNAPYNKNQFKPGQAMNAEANLYGGFKLRIRYTRKDGQLIYHEVSPKGFRQAADYMKWRYAHM